MKLASIRGAFSLLFLALIAITSTGCAHFGFAKVAQDSDPIVVNAERTTAISLSIVDEFLKFDDENRDFLRTKVPSVHAVAEQLRREAPAAFDRARSLTATYKLTRIPGDGDNVNDALTKIQELARLARQALLDSQRAKFTTNVLYHQQKASVLWQRLSQPSYRYSITQSRL